MNYFVFFTTHLFYAMATMSSLKVIDYSYT